MYNIHVTQNGVLKLLSNLNIHKDAGPDEIPTGLLTELAPCLLKPSQHLSKHPFNQGTLPTDWKEVFVVPIFKKGDTSRVSKYRPD